MTRILSILLLLSCGIAWAQPTLNIGIYNTIGDLTNAVPVITRPVVLIKAFEYATNRDGFFLLYDATATNAIDNSLVFGPGSGIGRYFKMTAMGGQPPGNYITSLTGAVVGSGPGAAATQLSSTGVTPGVYGGATMIPTFEVGSSGRILGATNVAISAGTTINSTDGAIPVRGGSGSFTNSPFHVASDRVTYRNGSNDVLSLFDDGGIFVGRNAESFWGGPPTGSYVSYRDVAAGDVNDNELWIQTDNAGANSLVGFFVPNSQATLDIKSQDASVTVAHIQLQTTTNGPTIIGNNGTSNTFSLDPNLIGSSPSPYFLSSSSTATNSTLRIDRGTNVSFVVAKESVAGDATKVFLGSGVFGSVPIPSAINATNISSGLVSNTEFDYLDGLTGNVQTNLNNRQVSGNYITALTGDVTASGPGSAAATLANSGVSAGTYRSVTVDAKGRATGGSNPTTFSGYGLSDTSANLATALTDETGSGAAVFATSPVFTTQIGVTGNITNSGTITSGGLILANVATGTSMAFATTNLGSAATPAITIGHGTSARSGFFMSGAKLVISQSDAVRYAFREGGLGLVLQSAGSYRWTSTSDPSDGNDDLLLQRDSAATLQLGGDSATALAQTIKSHDGSGTDKAGANLTLEGGQSTGTGRGGDLAIKTSLTSTTGSSANSYSTREYLSAKPVDLTEATATLFCNIALATNKCMSALLFAKVKADDGTEFQALGSTVNVAAVNKAGTVTATLTQVDGTVAASSGTLTPVTYTAVANGNGVDIKVAATSSLSQTTLRCKWHIVSLETDDVGTVTPQ